jgi:hypothetical protein
MSNPTEVRMRFLFVNRLVRYEDLNLFPSYCHFNETIESVGIRRCPFMRRIYRVRFRWDVSYFVRIQYAPEVSTDLFLEAGR